MFKKTIQKDSSVQNGINQCNLHQKSQNKENDNKNIKCKDISQIQKNTNFK